MVQRMFPVGGSDATEPVVANMRGSQNDSGVSTAVFTAGIDGEILTGAGVVLKGLTQPIKGSADATSIIGLVLAAPRASTAVPSTLFRESRSSLMVQAQGGGLRGTLERFQ